MPKYIHCGEWNKNNKYIFYTALCAFLTNYIYGFTFSDYLDEIRFPIKDKDKDNNKNNDNNHIIINFFFRYFGLLLFSFILYYIYIKNNISKTNLERNILFKSSSIKLIYNNSQESTKNKIFISPLFILLIMIIMVLQEISEEIFYKSNLRALDFWMLELPLLSYFNLTYFNVEIYRHHKLVIYLNLIICGISKIIYLIYSYNNYENNDNNDKNIKSVFKCYNDYWEVIPFGIITYFIIMISRAFALNEIKVLMEYKYISPIKLLIIYGIIGAVITTIIGLISSFFECNSINSSLDLKICKTKYNEKYYLENFKIWPNDISDNIILEIVLLLFGMFIYFFYRLFYILIIRSLNAIYIIFSNLIYTSLLIWIGFNNIQDYILVYKIIIQIMIIFGLLIYLEIIELDFCNLNYDVKENIIKRSILEWELKTNSTNNSKSNSQINNETSINDSNDRSINSAIPLS